MQYNLQSKYYATKHSWSSCKSKTQSRPFCLSSTFSQTYEVRLNPHNGRSLERLRTELFDIAVCR